MPPISAAHIVCDEYLSFSVLVFSDNIERLKMISLRSISLSIPPASQS